jgi:hypothetical protein
MIIRLVLNELFGTLETGFLTGMLVLSAQIDIRLGPGRSRVLAPPPTQRTA